MENSSYIEYDKRYSIGIEEGQKLLQEVHDKFLWQKRTFTPSDVYMTEINTDYWSSNNETGPNARIRYYLLEPNVSPELFVEYNHISWKGYLSFDRDVNPEDDLKHMVEMLQHMNFKFIFTIKERHRFFALEHNLIRKPLFRCVLSEVIYVFEDWKDVDYEFGFEPQRIHGDISLAQQETNLKRIFSKYLNFNEQLKERYEIGLVKYIAGLVERRD